MPAALGTAVPAAAAPAAATAAGGGAAALGSLATPVGWGLLGAMALNALMN